MGSDCGRGMNLAEQAARRIDLARSIGVEPRRWIVSGPAEVELVAKAVDAWSADGALLHGLPVERGSPRSEYGLDLVVAPR